MQWIIHMHIDFDAKRRFRSANFMTHRENMISILTLFISNAGFILYFLVCFLHTQSSVSINWTMQKKEREKTRMTFTTLSGCDDNWWMNISSGRSINDVIIVNRNNSVKWSKIECYYIVQCSTRLSSLLPVLSCHTCVPI